MYVYLIGIVQIRPRWDDDCMQEEGKYTHANLKKSDKTTYLFKKEETYLFHAAIYQYRHFKLMHEQIFNLQEDTF